MLPRPILRWKTLWFGILILGFIAWAWRRSASHSDEIAYTSQSTRYVVESHCSQLLFTSFPFPFYSALPSPGWEFHSEVPWDSDLTYFKPPFILINDGRFQFIWIAWWVPALSFLLPWSAFLIWRHQRMKRRDTPASGCSGGL